MARQPDVDHPHASTPLRVLRVGADEALTSRVDRVTAPDLHITPPRDGQGSLVRLVEGELLRLSWQAADGLRSVPTEVVASPEGSCTLRLRGPATRIQRRESVRAPIGFPVRLSWGAVELVGSTVDLSEGGCSCVLWPHARFGLDIRPPRTDEPIRVALDLHSDVVHAEADVVRLVRRSGVLLECAVTFVRLPEQTGDLIRAHVFTALRRARARTLTALY